MGVILREANQDDADVVYDISTSVHLSEGYRQLIPPEHYERFINKYTPSESSKRTYRHKFIERYNDPSWTIYVAEYDGVVRGFRMLHQKPDELELKGLFIALPYQGKGIGRQLFMVWKKHHQPGVPTRLKVIQGNKKAINLYESSGFVQEGLAEEQFFGAKQLIMAKY